MIESLINTVIQGDCLDVMKSMPDNCIDLVLTDPPYGIGFDTEKESMSAGMRIDGTQRVMKTWNNPKPKQYIKGNWDNSKPEKIYFDEIKRISKNQIIWGGNYFTDCLEPSAGWIVWDKKVPEKMSLSKCELAWMSIGGSVHIFRYLWAGYKKEKPEERFHTTQKPLNLMQWVIDKFSEQGMTIFDPFAGSGTTAIACLETGRNYILIEKEPEYVSIINKRISQWKEQGRLFPAHVV